MKNILIGILGLFLTACVKLQAIDFYSTLDTNSTPGNFYGSLYLSFSSTNSSDCYNGGLGDFEWNEVQIQPTYADSSSNAQLSLSFTVGPEGANTLNLYAGLTALSDARFGSLANTSSTHSVSPGYFAPGQPATDNMVSPSNNQQNYYDSAANLLITYDFNYSLPVNFDGTSGNAAGFWSLTYTVTPVPEPSANWLILLGGIGFLLARARARCT
jgi:hypothetical protein